MLELLQVIRIRRDFPAFGLTAGALGVVVDLLRGDGRAYEVEVVDDAGRPLFLGALPADLLDPVPEDVERERPGA
jgi:hypothetical protein